ncbi:hypothetical protein FQZ97_786280 [compost metagenome]
MPFGMAHVVDQFIGAELAQPLEPLGTGRQRQYPRPEQLGQLQGEHRDTAAALDQDALPRQQTAPRGECGPGGQRRARQGGRLLETEMIRSPHQLVLVHAGVLAQGSVHRATTSEYVAADGHLAAEPMRVEGQDHPLANANPAAAFADGYNLPGTVRARNRHVLAHRLVLTGQDQQFAEVQRGRPHPHQGLAGPWCRRRRQVTQHQPIETSILFDPIRSHDGLLPNHCPDVPAAGADRKRRRDHGCYAHCPSARHGTSAAGPPPQSGSPTR